MGLQALDDWKGWPDGKLLLIGPKGSGKTHLTHIWADDCQAVIVQAKALDGIDIAALGPNVAVENAEDVAGNLSLETALFHLHNLTVPKGRLLINACLPPRDWGLLLPDLQSRLQAAALARLCLPDDALLTAVLVKLFADRQVNVGPALVSYLITRIDRSIAAAQAVVIALDHMALTLGRPITRQMASEFLDNRTDE
jgi:chromosomal replication initiation ATPase DnaA